MLAAPAAMPPNPKMAAITATIRKITIQRIIAFEFSERLILAPKKWCHITKIW